MLTELFTYLTMPCPRYVRHMDYLYEAIAMRGRFRRNRAAWQPHLDRSKQFIRSAAERCSNRTKAVILGAGLLLDVPLDELSTLFQEVVLADIILLPEVRRHVKRYRNVRLLQLDVTNMAGKLHENILQGRHELPEAAFPVPALDENTGLVVSLNILSQLWVMPRAYAMKKLRYLDEEQLDEWCGRIVRSHYDFLNALHCDVSLIADHEFIKRDRSGNIVSRDSTVYDLSLLAPDESWIWNIAPSGEERRYLSKELVVGAWRFRGRHGHV
jgi:hypothetical protein